MPQITYTLRNLDFEKTVEKIMWARELLRCLEDDIHRGHPWRVWFKDFPETTFHIYHTGTMHVTWKTPKEKEILTEMLRPFLVPISGREVKWIPETQNLTIPHGTENIDLYWCAELHRYTLSEIRNNEAPSPQRSRPFVFVRCRPNTPPVKF